MSELQRATLIPFDEQGNSPQDDKKISLDFNPDTLTIKVSNTLQDVPGRKGRQRTQFVGSSSSTLTFEAVFDSTRPTNLPGEAPGDESPERLDVRKRTEPIAGLLQVSDPDAEHPAPKRVRFSWGSVLFDGIIDQYSEVLEYFSPEGVPLRSKVSISIKEQSFEYQIDATKRATLASFGGGAKSVERGSPTSAFSALGASINQASSIASQNGLDSLLQIGASGSLSFNASLSADLGARSASNVGLDLGVGVDLSASAGATIDVSAGTAIEVFGGATVQAVVGGGVDLSASARGEATTATAAASATPTSWAPSGPTAGSRASALASIVNEQRAFGAATEPLSPSGGAFTATTLASAPSPKPLPVKGSPPLSSARVGSLPGAVMVSARTRPAPQANLTGDRPRWEALVPDTRAAALGAPCCASCGKVRTTAMMRGTSAPCGCRGGGHRGDNR